MAFTITDNYVHSLLDENKDGARSTDDLERALYVLQRWQRDGSNGSPYKMLREYMVREPAINWLSSNVIPKLGVEVVVTEEKVERRKDKYARLERFALENVYGEFTTQQLVDMSGLGAQTISKWAKTTGYFRSAGRGSWEARNPKDDRDTRS